MDAALISAAVAIAVVVLGGLVTWLTVRRTASGKIGTSEAAVLWEQAQAMRAELVAHRDKAIEQRDRLMESQTALLIPMLTGINGSLQQITESLAQITESLARTEGRDGGPGRRPDGEGQAD
jgi:hypothetical protein